jgi:hypothetical protein
MAHVSFCFLLTKDLNKEHIWRSWLSQLDISYSLFVHCSNPDNIHSQWLQQYIIPQNKIVPTSWGKLGQAIYNLFEYASSIVNRGWYTMNSESCVPIISAIQFSNLCRKYVSKSIIDYRNISWNTETSTRGNLHKFDKDYHLVHSGWYVLTNTDIINIIECRNKYADFCYNALFNTEGKLTDEHGIAIILKKMNQLTNTIKGEITIVDWSRSNGNSPYTFAEDSQQNREYIETARKEYTCFLRKVAPSFPDEIITKYL